MAGPLRTLHSDTLLDARELVPEMEADREQKCCHTRTNMPTRYALPVDQEEECMEIGLTRVPLPVDYDDVVADAQGQESVEVAGGVQSEHEASHLQDQWMEDDSSQEM